ncbi:MAG: isoprenylcysteine carboxylmethyltransferase family protein [Gemmatimonadetes bacterium]|nr:isoprenylcysteine carboxylmethyltransferase family protein [Gemmatimonadota bacterium]
MSWWRGNRGEWYVVAQLGLFGLVAFGPRSLPGWPAWPALVEAIARPGGAVLLAAGAIVLALAVRRLGRSLTPLPAPTRDSELAVTGPFALVRHPIYSAVILLAFGWALFARGTLTLGYASLLAVFLDRKASREERWLLDRYPGYADYRARVRKLIPFLY